MHADIPSNAGFYRPITVTAPEGSILNPRRPAPRAARGLTGFRVVDTVLGALGEGVPGRVPAAGDGGATMIAIGAPARTGLPSCTSTSWPAVGAGAQVWMAWTA